MKELILKLKYCGLGDHLLHSHLPRIAKQFGGYGKVYISNHSAYRDVQTKELVWELNPFVDGFTNKDAEYKQAGNPHQNMNLLDKVMLVNGMDDDLQFHEPEIYYVPKIIPELKDAIIFDPNFGTKIGHPTSQEVQRFLYASNIKVTHQMTLRSNYNPIECDLSLCSANLKHFCDIIVSCKQLICFHTGTSVLAAALNIPVMVLINGEADPRFKHSRIVRYITLKKGHNVL